MQTKWLSPNEVKAVIAHESDYNIFYFKYVRVGNEFRFADIKDDYCPDHCSAVRNGETALSAGRMKYVRGVGILAQDYSMTLNIGPAKDDEDLLNVIFKEQK